MTEIVPYIFYRDVPAALAWLTQAFGFVEQMRVDTPGGGMHAEMMMDRRRIMLGQPAGPGHAGIGSPADARVATMGVFLYLDEIDDHFARARDAGAEIMEAPHDVSYGRTYAAKDLEGHPWFFTVAPPG